MLGQRFSFPPGSDPTKVYTATQAELKATLGVRSQVVETIMDSRSMDRAKQAEELMLRQEIKLLTFVDPLYKLGVNNFPNQPAVLYYKGNLRPPQTSVGIIGSWFFQNGSRILFYQIKTVAFLSEK